MLLKVFLPQFVVEHQVDVPGELLFFAQEEKGVRFCLGQVAGGRRDDGRMGFGGRPERRPARRTSPR